METIIKTFIDTVGDSLIAASLHNDKNVQQYVNKKESEGYVYVSSQFQVLQSTLEYLRTVSTQVVMTKPKGLQI